MHKDFHFMVMKENKPCLAFLYFVSKFPATFPVSLLDDNAVVKS